MTSGLARIVGAGKRLAMLRAYFDECGKSDDPQHISLTVAGYAMHVDDWDRFDDEWRKVLGNHDAAYFHCREALFCVDGFKTWDVERVAALYIDLIELLKKHQQFGIASTVDMEAYAKLYPGPYKGDDGWNDPYCRAASTCWAFAETVPPRNEKLGIVMDANDQYAGAAQQLFRDFHRSASERIVGPLAFDSAKNVCGLQAADILAWEINKQFKERTTQSGRPTRKSFSALIETISWERFKFWDSEELSVG